MIEEYLREHGAIGKSKAIKTSELKQAMRMHPRNIADMVMTERAAGALICSTNSGNGGYYLPSCVDEIRKQRDKLERGIKIRAVVLRPFRKYLKEYEQSKVVKE